jgi:hypothetical protein
MQWGLLPDNKVFTNPNRCCRLLSLAGICGIL